MREGVEAWTKADTLVVESDRNGFARPQREPSIQRGLGPETKMETPQIGTTS
jgi:hypothetical protein